jgi:RNase P subunit RPR2
MSAAATRRFVASVSVDRACVCGATFTVRKGATRVLCTLCTLFADAGVAERRRVQAEREAARAAERAALTCDECGHRLLVPAALCGFCDPDFDAAAALAALDAAGATR